MKQTVENLVTDSPFGELGMKKSVVVLTNRACDTCGCKPGGAKRLTCDGLVVQTSQPVAIGNVDSNDGSFRRPSVSLVHWQQRESDREMSNSLDVTNHAATLRNGRDAHPGVRRKLAVLRVRAENKTQIPRHMELNLEITRFEAEQTRYERHLQINAGLSP